MDTVKMAPSVHSMRAALGIQAAMNAHKPTPVDRDIYTLPDMNKYLEESGCMHSVVPVVASTVQSVLWRSLLDCCITCYHPVNFIFMAKDIAVLFNQQVRDLYPRCGSAPKDTFFKNNYAPSYDLGLLGYVSRVPVVADCSNDGGSGFIVFL